MKLTEKKTEEEAESLEKFIENTRKKFLKSNVTLPLLQREHAKAAANHQTKKRELLNINESKQEKRYVQHFDF